MSDPTLKFGESFTRRELPDEISRRMLRRADAEQNRHINTARIADSLERLASTGSGSRLEVALIRIADALDRAFPLQPSEPEPEVTHNEAGLPIPPELLREHGADA